MKNLYFLALFVFFINCDNKKSQLPNSIIDSQFQNFKQVEALENYTKVSYTSIYNKGSDPAFGILHLKNQEENLILFNQTKLDASQERTFRVLDTLRISNLEKNEYITIGYCEINGQNNENLIAIVEKTDSLKIQRVKKVWQANEKTKKIEFLEEPTNVTCLNEWYSEK